MSFKTTAIITSIVLFLLGACYLIIGELVIGRWQIQLSEAVLLLGRRMGAVYLGLSIMFFLVRSAPVSVGRTAVCAGTATVTSLLVLLGIYELVAGHVGTGILASIAVETLLAVAYIRIVMIDRKQSVGA
jgi:hypothetical protein